jgi:hypothetical protein
MDVFIQVGVPLTTIVVLVLLARTFGQRMDRITQSISTRGPEKGEDGDSTDTSGSVRNLLTQFGELVSRMDALELGQTAFRKECLRHLQVGSQRLKQAEKADGLGLEDDEEVEPPTEAEREAFEAAIVPAGPRAPVGEDGRESAKRALQRRMKGG